MKKNYRKISIVFLVFAFVNIGTVVAQNIGEPAPDFTLTTTTNQEFKLSEQKGKVVFLFFVGYSCPYCINNAPYTETAIYQKYKNDADFVAVAIDLWDGDAAAAQSFVTKSGINYPLLMKGKSVGVAFDLTYDRVLVIDKEGILRYKGDKAASTSEVDAAESVIATYLEMEPVGIVSNKFEKLSVYPNPASDAIFIASDLTDSDVIEYTVYNSVGQVMIKQSVGGNLNSLQIDVTPLNGGVYFLQIRSDEMIASSRFVVNRK